MAHNCHINDVCSVTGADLPVNGWVPGCICLGKGTVLQLPSFHRARQWQPAAGAVGGGGDEAPATFRARSAPPLTAPLTACTCCISFCCGSSAGGFAAPAELAK